MIFGFICNRRFFCEVWYDYGPVGKSLVYGDNQEYLEGKENRYTGTSYRITLYEIYRLIVWS